MRELSSPTSTSQSRALRLGGSHGYRIEGDLAALNAELSLGRDRSALHAQHWALQLWACDEPYGGGALSGFKVAEAPIALPAGEAEPPLLDAVLSVDEVGIFKPDFSVYRLVTDRLDVAPGAVCFVSSNGWDAHAAADFGFQVAWANRAGLPRENLPGTLAAEIGSLAELPALLGI